MPPPGFKPAIPASDRPYTRALRMRGHRVGLTQGYNSNGVKVTVVTPTFETKHKIVNNFLIIKPTRCTNYSNLFFEWNSTCFGQFLCPSSGVFHCTHSNGICHTVLLTACEQEHLLLLTSCHQTCMTYTIAVCTVKNSWCWTEELSEIFRVSFRK